MNRPRKRFGQHFLADRTFIERIVGAVAPAATDHVLEIGPGRGAITRPLLATGCRLTVVELDRDLAARLRTRSEKEPRLTVIEDDALRVDLTALAGDQPVRLVGNLPYNVSTPLIFHFLQHLPAVVDQHFMLQKEVIDRMAADPGSKAYGRLSIAVQVCCRVTPLFDVPPTAFDPPPRVWSSVARLEAVDDHRLSANETAVLDLLLKQAFSQRRKTLRNGLKKLLPEAALLAAEIDPALRPENVPVEGYVRLVRTSIQSGMLRTP